MFCIFNKNTLFFVVVIFFLFRSWQQPCGERAMQPCSPGCHHIRRRWKHLCLQRWDLTSEHIIYIYMLFQHLNHCTEVTALWSGLGLRFGCTPSVHQSLIYSLMSQATITSVKMTMTHWPLTPSRMISRSCTVRWTPLSLMKITFTWSR